MKRRLACTELKPGFVLVELPHWLHHCLRLPLILKPWHLRLLRLCRVPEVEIDPQLEAESYERLDPQLQQQLESLLNQLPLTQSLRRPLQASPALNQLQAEDLQQDALLLLGRVFAAAQTEQPLAFDELQRLSRRLMQASRRAPQALLLLCQLRQPDAYLVQHAFSSTVLMAVMLNELGIDDTEQPDWLLGCLLMGLGKSRLPEGLLTKTTELSLAERLLIEQQVELTLNLLADYPLPELSRRLIAEHHERHDGSGYPNGLAADALSLAGELAGLVDVYDALISDRHYRHSQPPSRILGDLLNERRFRPERVAQLIRALGVYPIGALVVLTSNRVALVLAQGKDWQTPKVRVIYSLTHQQYLPPRDLDLHQTQDPILRYYDPSQLNLDFRAFI